MLSCSDVHNFLVEAGVPHEVLHLPAHSRTARAAAELLGVSLGEVVKSLVFYLDRSPTLVLVPGDKVVDVDRLKQVAGCADAVLAKGKQVLEVTGYRAGAVPPCGLTATLPAVADATVFDPLVVYCGGGTSMTMLKLRSDDLRRVVKPLVGGITASLERTA